MLQINNNLKTIQNMATLGKQQVDIIGYDSGWGCGDFGCEDGPASIAADQIIHALAQSGYEARALKTLGVKFLGDHQKLKTKEDTLPLVREGLDRLFRNVQKSLQDKHIPLIIGGDHSSAMGTWPAVVSTLHCAQKFGLIWIDAHLDCHTYETSHQGKWGGWWHGQPIPALTGQGLAALTAIGGKDSKISPAHISIIGAHSFEPAEEEFVRKNNIRVFFLEEVQSRGFAAVLQEALARATTGTEGFGFSIDLDAFHGVDAPGVGTPENKGLLSADVLPVMKSIAKHPLFRALEIVEFNPHNDVENKTRTLINRLIQSIFA